MALVASRSNAPQLRGHQNIVQLLGFTKTAMVTESSPNNVQQAILSRRGKRFALKKTASFALDAAKGLQVFLNGVQNTMYIESGVF